MRIQKGWMWGAGWCAAVMLMAPHHATAKRRSLDTSPCPLETIHFDDGDSFSCGSEHIRVLGIDAPEIEHPEHGFMEGQPKGREAAAFTEKTIRSAKRIVIVRDGKDPYGRTLAYVLLDGELLEVRLLQAGFAYANIDRYGDNRFPEFALQVEEAAKVAKKPTFQDPHVWRQRHRAQAK